MNPTGSASKDNARSFAGWRCALAMLAIGGGLPGWSGCAIHYYDAKSGTEHLWGVGHMKMKAAPSNEGMQAVVLGTESIGASIGTGKEEVFLALGWVYRRRIQVGEDASVRLEWPTADFFDVRVGSKPPATMQQTSVSSKQP